MLLLNLTRKHFFFFFVFVHTLDVLFEIRILYLVPIYFKANLPFFKLDTFYLILREIFIIYLILIQRDINIIILFIHLKYAPLYFVLI